MSTDTSKSEEWTDEDDEQLEDEHEEQPDEDEEQLDEAASDEPAHTSEERQVLERAAHLIESGQHGAALQFIATEWNRLKR